jgi:HNH endonuclease
MSSSCDVAGCELPVFVKARMLCRKHYKRWHKYGDPTFQLRMRNEPVEDRFFFKIDRTGPEDHWLWKGSTKKKGYGHFWADGKIWAVHRWAYTHFIGPIPEGLVIDHLCRIRNCVNPFHLEPVTAAENTERGDFALMGPYSHRTGCGCRTCVKWRRDGKIA